MGMEFDGGKVLVSYWVSPSNLVIVTEFENCFAVGIDQRRSYSQLFCLESTSHDV